MASVGQGRHERRGMAPDARVSELAAVGAPLVAADLGSPWGEERFHELYPI